MAVYQSQMYQLTDCYRGKPPPTLEYAHMKICGVPDLFGIFFPVSFRVKE